MNLNFIKKNDGELSIVFVHGNSLSMKNFVNQFEDARFDDFQIIAVDLPGHGNSYFSKNPETDYRIEELSNSLCEFVNNEMNNDVVLVGSSMGGNIVIEATQKINNLKAMVLFGTSPVSSSTDIAAGFMPTEAISYAFNRDISESQLNDMCRANLGENYEYDNLLKDDIRKTDKNFREFLGASAAKGEFKDEKKIVNELDLPIAIIHGEKDQIANVGYLNKLKIPTLWREEIQIIKNAPHLIHLTNPKEFNSLLHQFINDLNKNHNGK